MYDLTRFGLTEMIHSGQHLRTVALSATCMQEAAQALVDALYTGFRFPGTDDPECALVRCFKTHPYAGLPPTLQEIARSGLIDFDPPPAMRCLTLLATCGLEPAWCSPEASLGHRAIPLPTSAIVEQAPMIARLIVQMGLDIQDLVDPEPGFLIDLERQSFNVFHVEDAVGSRYVPAQEAFVIPYGIRSVLGFGGILPSGELFVVVMFCRVTVSRETAALFRTLALSVKLALLPFSGRQIFRD